MQSLQQLPLKEDSSQRKSKPMQLSEDSVSNDAGPRQDDQDINALSNKCDSLTPSREVMEGLQSLEHGSNLDVTSLLIKKKRRVKEASNKENQAGLPNGLGLCDFTQTQPPPSVCPPLGFDDVSDPQAIDALVDTLSRVLTRSLCQSHVKNLDIWGDEPVNAGDASHLNRGIDQEHTLGVVDDTTSVPSGVGDTQLTTHVPSPPITQSSSQPLVMGPSDRPCSVSSLESASQQQLRHQQQHANHIIDRRPLLADGHGTSPSMNQKLQHISIGGSGQAPHYTIRHDGEGLAAQSGFSSGWTASQSPAMYPQNPNESPPPLGFFPRSLSVPLAENHLAPPHFYPVRSPFMSTAYDDQCLVGGFPVSEWRRFFVYLATMDTQALLAYLSTQSGGTWCLDRGLGVGGPQLSPTQLSPQAPDPPRHTAFSWNPHACQPPPQTVHSPLSVTQNQPPPPPPSTSKASSINAGAGPIGSSRNVLAAARAPRRRAQSKPWRRQDIPPPSEGRFKQIARAKATPEYLLYIGHVKKEDRDVAAGDPMTPRVEGTTWREFQQDVRAWKRSLHRKAETLQMAG